MKHGKTRSLVWAFGVLQMALCGGAHASNVVPPPLPPGSQMVTIEAGVNPDEKERGKKAHRPRGQVKKKYLIDDSISTTPAAVGTTPNGK